MNLLSLYHFFAGKASDKQKEAIKRWAESSPDNYETLCREKKIFDAGILLVDKKELSQKENAPLLYKLINYTVKIAAVVLLVVVSVTIYKYQELVKKSEVLQTILVPAGQRINIILPDSTFVCLNSNTKFSYPSVFATNNRKVKLDGEAYFEVYRPIKISHFMYILQKEKSKYSVLILIWKLILTLMYLRLLCLKAKFVSE